jgi:hypothetical protein
MAYVNDMKNSTHDDIKALATKHGSWETFWQDVQRLAEQAWHNARAQGHDPSTVEDKDGNDGAPVENEPAPAATMTPGPTDEGQPYTAPAEPASPVSGGGFPTSNVGVVVSPDPEDGTPVPVEEHESQPLN